MARGKTIYRVQCDNNYEKDHPEFVSATVRIYKRRDIYGANLCEIWAKRNGKSMWSRGRTSPLSEGDLTCISDGWGRGFKMTLQTDIFNYNKENPSILVKNSLYWKEELTHCSK